MIQILALHIEEFRGIRNLTLKLDGKSFVVHGPNGSGKSGVVDAIGFALTGTIARLSGVGMGGVSVQRHGPHVHKRDDPASAKVSLTFLDTVSGTSGTVSRSIKTAQTATLEPDTPELRQALDAASRHPELTLSRREIIKFILAEPGRRASDVQLLLQLDVLDLQRKALKSALTKVAKDRTSARDNMQSAIDGIQRHLDIPRLTSEGVQDAVNARRQILGLISLEQVGPATDLKTGLEQSSESPFDKASALRDIGAFREARALNEGSTSKTTALKEAVAAFGEDSSVLDMHIRRLLRSYNQVGVLVRKQLIDSDVAFALIGPGLDTCWPALEPAIDYYQQFYGGDSGTELNPLRRPIYSELLALHNKYERWSARQIVVRP